MNLNIMTKEEFRNRIRAICTGDLYSVFGASHAHPCVVRKQTKQTYEEEKPQTTHTDTVSRAASKRV